MANLSLADTVNGTSAALVVAGQLPAPTFQRTDAASVDGTLYDEYDLFAADPATQTIDIGAPIEGRHVRIGKSGDGTVTVASSAGIFQPQLGTSATSLEIISSVEVIATSQGWVIANQCCPTVPDPMWYVADNSAPYTAGTPWSSSPSFHVGGNDIYYPVNATTTVLVFNHDSGWSTGPALPVALQGGAGAQYVAARSAAYLMGGEVGSTTQDTVRKLSGDPLSWSTVGTLTVPMRRFGSFSIGESIYVFGGYKISGTTPNFDTYRYDTATDTCSAALTPFPGTANLDIATFSLGGKGYAVGGQKSGAGIFTFEVWQYDPAEEGGGTPWVAVTDIPSGSLSPSKGITEHKAVVYRGKAYVIGGTDSSGKATRRVWKFTPPVGATPAAWTETDALPASEFGGAEPNYGLYRHIAATNGAGTRILVASGRQNAVTIMTSVFASL